MDLVPPFGVYLVAFDPTLGSEIKKTRSCIVVSPNEMNRPLNAVHIAPLTSTKKGSPTRVGLTFQGKSGEIVLDKIRIVDKSCS